MFFILLYLKYCLSTSYVYMVPRYILPRYTNYNNIYSPPEINVYYTHPMNLLVNHNIHNKMETVKLDWHHMLYNIKTGKTNYMNYRQTFVPYIDNKLRELEPLKTGLVLDSSKWRNLNIFTNQFFQHKLNRKNSNIEVYIGETPLVNYLIYKRIFLDKSYILVAHKTAKIEYNFLWENNVVVMENANIHLKVHIGRNNIIGPNCIIDSNSHICHNNILLENITIHKFTKIIKNNIFLGNNRIGSDNGINGLNFFRKMFEINNEFHQKIKQNKHLIEYFKCNNIVTEIGSCNIFHLGVKIDSFSQIYHFNIFKPYVNIASFVLIYCNCIFGRSSTIQVDVRIETGCKIEENDCLVENTRMLKDDIIIS